MVDYLKSRQPVSYYIVGICIILIYTVLILREFVSYKNQNHPPSDSESRITQRIDAQNISNSEIKQAGRDIK